MSGLDWLGAIGCALAGIRVGWDIRGEFDIRRERKRRDEASQFAPLDTVTFGDGSYVVIASVPSGKDGAS